MIATLYTYLPTTLLLKLTHRIEVGIQAPLPFTQTRPTF
jgi:hypothetical protein